MTDLTQKIKQANARLKKSNIGVSIQQLGGKLYLRGMFPPKPDSGKLVHYQQRLSVARANEQGLKLAESKAKEIGGLLDQGRFEWEIYRPELTIKENHSVSEWLELFKEDYFSTRAKTPNLKRLGR